MSFEDSILERAGSGGEVQTPIVTVVAQVEEDPDGGGPSNLTSTRITGRLRQIGPGLGVPVENVTFDRSSNTFIAETTSLIELEDLRDIENKMDNILEAEGLTVLTTLVGAEVKTSRL